MMCEQSGDNTIDHTPTAAPSRVEQEVEWLRGQLAIIRQELVDLRMGQRKVLLEELAMHENPLIEQGVIAQRTRPPRHGRPHEGVD